MITGPVKNAELWWRFLEHGPNVLSFLGNVAVNNEWEIVGRESRRGDRLWPELLVDVVKFSNLFEYQLNFTIDSFDLFFAEGRLYNFFLFHEDLRENLIHVDSWDFVELALVDHGDKVVHFLGVTKTSCPDLELDVFVFDALDHVGEEELHLILHGTELRDFGVGIFIENVFDLTPFHFLAILMKQRALFSVFESIGTDEARLTALGIDTDHETLVTVNTLRRVFEVFGGHLNIYLRL